MRSSLTSAAVLAPADRIALLALLLSLFAVFSDRCFFRGPRVTLANQADAQHASVDLYANEAPWVKELFPGYTESTRTAIVRLVWLNTGDRASYVFLRNVRVTDNEGTPYACASYSYTPVPAGEAALQALLVRDLPRGKRLDVNVVVDFEWQRFRPFLLGGSGPVRQSGTIRVEVVPTGERRRGDAMEYAHVVLEYVKALIWPVVVLIILLRYRRTIHRILEPVAGDVDEERVVRNSGGPAGSERG